MKAVETRQNNSAEIKDSRAERTSLKTAIAIPVFNEEDNIGKLLVSLGKDLPEEVEKIIVVSSGSIDKTDRIVGFHEERDHRVRLFTEEERRGKSSALNILLNECRPYDAVIYLGGDNIPEHGALERLLNALENGVSMAGGRPVPVNPPSSLPGFCVHLLWNLHHLISLDSPKISGELMAFKTGVLRELPPKIINDDSYLQILFETRGHRTKYCPEARVRLRGPTSIREFLRQRRRVRVGHHQLGFLSGRNVSTAKLPAWSLVMKACPFGGLKGKMYALAFLLLEGSALLLSRWDFRRQNLPYKWEMCKSTKKLSRDLTQLATA